ncbi:MAG: TrbG/VirB9 family P-type conjugative transfer protein [Deltaproteobacteria bacterium]|nr:TrbG/VirB9 family P-type conjugative transfer protein [Deltaproteobacteria bacterium]
MKWLAAALLTVILMSSPVNAHVRNITANGDNILNVRTALGIATIIQLPETIQSAIIGDGSGFKVEYLDRAVTIKPLRFGVKTNLYLVTEKRRYNLRLVTQAQDLADYVVYVRNPDIKDAVRWRKFNQFGEADNIRLTVNRIAVSDGGFVLIDAKISSNSNETKALKPEDFWIVQGNTSRTVNGLFVSGLGVSKSNPISVGISLAKSELVATKPIVIELRMKHKISVSISEANLWN